MTDEEIEALIKLLVVQLEEVGLGELADERLYQIRDEETGEGFLPPPGKYLIEILETFERHLSIMDRHTYDNALYRISQFVEDAPKAAVVELPATRGVARAEHDLGQLSFLSDIRGELHTLIGQLREAGFGPSRPRS